MILQPTLRSEHDARTNNAIRPDYCPRADLRRRVHDCGRVNLRPTHLSRNVNIRSPSETTASFTTHLHDAFAMRLPRDLVISA